LHVIRKFLRPALCVLPGFVFALSLLLKSRAALQLESLPLRHQIGIFQRSFRSISCCGFARNYFGSPHCIWGLRETGCGLQL